MPAKAKRKSKAADGVEQSPATSAHTKTHTRSPQSDDNGLPFAPYCSAVAVHTTLLSFISLYLPRTAFLSDLTRPAWDPSKLTSKDKPQHPFLEQLTISPVLTVAWICLGVVFLQIWWAGWTRKWHINTVVKGSEDDKRMQSVALQGQRVRHLRDACIATFLASLVFHVILVLLGAPLTNCSTPFANGADCPSDNLHLRTYLLALLLALLTVPAAVYTLGVPSVSKNDSQTLVHTLLWTRLFAERSVRNPLERALVYPVVGTLIGSWVGVIPIPLDWDRPWQAWPLTPAYGAIAGYTVASLAALTATAVNFLAVEHLRSRDQQTAEMGPKTKPKLKAT